MTGYLTQDWFPIVNESGLVIPPYSLVRPLAGNPTSGALPVDRPSADNDTFLLVTGEASVPIGKQGIATYATRGILAYDLNDGTPQTGECWGSAAGSWALKRGYSGWRTVGVAGGGLVNAFRDILAAANPSPSSSSGSAGVSVRLVSEVVCDGSLMVDHGELSGQVAVGGRIYPVVFRLTPTA